MLKFFFKYISDPEKAQKYTYDLNELKRYASGRPLSFHFRDMLNTIFEGSKINSCNDSLP
jgi:hypothetical protein